jgi:hypothetical protein
MSGPLLMMTFGSATTGPFGVTASPPSLASGGRFDAATTDTVTAIVSGGSGSFTYAWTVPTTDGHPVVPTAPTAATTAFNIGSIGAGDEVSAVARCTVTDTVTSAIDHVDVFISHIDFRGDLH